MSRYTVVSAPEAENELAAIWIAAQHRGQVSAAADTADRMLGENPLQDSVYLSGELLRRDILPLRFYFEVLEEDRVVVISSVTRLPD